MTATMAERVAAGAALLDDKDPGWWHADAKPAIDLDCLNMASGCNCVVGQRIAQPQGYADRCTQLFGWGDSLVTGIEYGFYAGHDGGQPDHDAQMAELDAEWRRVITERRSQS